MPAAGARSKEGKMNLMDCICLCSEVEMRQIQIILLGPPYGDLPT